MAGGESSPSFSPITFTYDVFLSFRGEDTRFSFTGNLYSALYQSGINTFIDDNKIGRGKEITPSLVTAIEESRIAITVLSKNYASSSFCLDELATIMVCSKGKGRLVIPVFYDVDPSDVRKQRGTYGEALVVHENMFKAKTENLHDNMIRLERWTKALNEVANLSGYHFKQGGGKYEFEFIAKIVEQVSTESRRVTLPLVDHPVGLDFKVQEVIQFLELGSNDGVRVVGIHGIGGIGKTTLAVAVYNWIADRSANLSFEGLCFLEKVKENSHEHGLQYIQKALLSKIFRGEKVELTSVREGISVLEQRLQSRKILLILDDVSQVEHLEALAGKSDWFGHGSRIIITTRDINLLSRDEDKIMYDLEELNAKDALELLSWKALKTNKVDPSYVNVLNDLIAYASGLPLALEVIGSNLMGKNIEQWKSALDQYKRIPNKKIQTILKVSFDALEEFEKEIFLDIACCFKGYELTDVRKILCAHHCVVSLEYGLRVLVEKSLIKIDGYHGVTLHALIQDMGREIVRQESPTRPGERSRLWLLEDIVQVFEKKMATHQKGTLKIEMIQMASFQSKKIKWDGEAFKEMKNLKTLIIRQACFSQGPKHLPDSLRVLRWENYPSHSLPPDFHPEELLILELSGICLMSVGFLDRPKFMSLTVIELDKSGIEEIPDVAGNPNLKKLTFTCCRNLIKVHESIGFLDKLEELDAEGCIKLRSFPPIRLTSLARLNLRDCSSLENFPEILGEMKKIEGIRVTNTSIKELPYSIKNLTKLRYLTLENCDMLQLIPSSIVKLPYLEVVYVRECKGLRFPKLHEGEDQGGSVVSSKSRNATFADCNMSNEFVPIVLAWFRDAAYSNLSGDNFKVLPESIEELCSLRTLNLDDFLGFQEIRGISPDIKDFNATNRISLTSSSRSMLLNEELNQDGEKLMFNFSGSIPKWFCDSNWKDSISFWFRNNLPAISLCVVTRKSQVYARAPFSDELIINGNKVSSVHRNAIERVGDPYHVTIFDLIIGEDILDEVNSEENWNHAEIRFVTSHGVKDRIKQIGMRVDERKSSMEDISFTIPRCLTERDDELLTGETEISLRPCWQEPLDSENLKSNLMQLASTSDTIRDEDQAQAMLELDHFENTPAESSQGPSFAETQNIQAASPTSSNGIASGEELHQKTCCVLLPTTTDEPSRNQVDISQDDDAEMQAFYASLDAGTHVLSSSHDHSATTAPSEEAKEALKIVQDLITDNDASVFLDHGQCNIMKNSLNYLSNLSANDGLSREMRELISEALRVFTHCSGNYIEADMKIESTASELLRADKLEANLEDNKNQFMEVAAFEKELLQKMACLEASKKELEKQINAIKANISASEAERNINRKKRRDIFEEGKALKTQMGKLREKVPYLQHEQDLAKVKQAKIKAEWSEFGEKFKKIVVE